MGVFIVPADSDILTSMKLCHIYLQVNTILSSFWNNQQAVNDILSYSSIMPSSTCCSRFHVPTHISNYLLFPFPINQRYYIHIALATISSVGTLKKHGSGGNTLAELSPSIHTILLYHTYTFRIVTHARTSTRRRWSQWVQ